MKPELQIAFIGAWFFVTWLSGFICGNRKMDQTVWIWIALFVTGVTAISSLGLIIQGSSDFIKHLTYLP